MEKKKIGIDSISLLLVVLAFFWAFSIKGFCLGDNILAFLKLPSWSNGTSGTHYTIFYSFIFLIPSLIISLKYKNDLFSKVGKWLSIIFIAILLLGFVFMIG